MQKNKPSATSRLFQIPLVPLATRSCRSAMYAVPTSVGWTTTGDWLTTSSGKCIWDMQKCAKRMPRCKRNSKAHHLRGTRSRVTITMRAAGGRDTVGEIVGVGEVTRVGVAGGKCSVCTHSAAFWVFMGLFYCIFCIPIHVFLKME